ncbi:MAG: SanA/YdcF family protein [Bacillota bacterium]|jgi:SanA protein
MDRLLLAFLVVSGEVIMLCCLFRKIPTPGTGRKGLKHKAIFFGSFVILFSAIVLSVNYYVWEAGQKYISGPDSVPEADAILILGARVHSDGNVSLMLHDRLTTGYELFEKGKAPKIIVSGDHGRKEYDEVNAMKSFLKEKSVPSEDIFMDHAGFSTYESLYRARDIFQVKKVIIVTQEFHLTRALFIARELGLEAHGVAADKHIYHTVMLKSELREILARNKDFLTAKIIKPLPTYLGDVIPVTGDGRVTDDKE